jgi:hypothetical protein
VDNQGARGLEIFHEKRDDPLQGKGLLIVFTVDVCTSVKGRILDHNLPIILHLALQKRRNSSHTNHKYHLVEAWLW